MRRVLLLFAGAGFFLLIASCLVIGLIASLVGITLRYESQTGARVIQLVPLATPGAISSSVLAATSAPPVAERVVSSPMVTLQPSEVSTVIAVVTDQPAIAPPTISPVSIPTATLLPTVQSDQYVVTRLVIPRLSLDVPVLFAPIEGETWNVAHLEQRVGHLERTAAPGAPSNLVLAGHVTLDSGAQGPFARLDSLLPEDVVLVYQGDQAFKYVVDQQQIVDPADITVTYPTSEARLTLITCNGWNESLQQYTARLVVTAHLLQK